MRTFDLLALVALEVAPKATKIQLATWYGGHDPLMLLRTRGFEEWQCWQTKRNFERDCSSTILVQTTLVTAQDWRPQSVRRSIS